jgi:sugar lactone lactonase YvrE
MATQGKKHAHWPVAFLLTLASSLTIAYAWAATPTINTVAGSGAASFSGDGGPAAEAGLNSPTGIAFDELGNLYIPDRLNHRVRKVIVQTGIIATIAGSGLTGPANGGYAGDGGPATEARLNLPGDVAVDGSGNVYIADTYNHRIRQVITSTHAITTVAGTGAAGYSGDNGPAAEAELRNPAAVAVDGMGNLYIADANNNRIRNVLAATGIITTVAGSGPIGHAAGGFSGDGGPAANAQLNYPVGVAVDSMGNVYVADAYNHRIRQIRAVSGVITTVVGSGPVGPDNGEFGGDGGPATEARLNFPVDVSVDASGNLYVADTGNHRVRMVLAATGVITTIAGTGVPGYGGDGGPAVEAALNLPAGIEVDGAGHVYIADQDNHRVRRVEGAAGAPRLFLPMVLRGGGE